MVRYHCSFSFKCIVWDIKLNVGVVTTNIMLGLTSLFLLYYYSCAYCFNYILSIFIAGYRIFILPTILLYRYKSGLEYFGILCMYNMAMFIILSIGADDIFVIVDTWQQYWTVAPNEPLDKRLTATLKHAGKVMATLMDIMMNLK